MFDRAIIDTDRFMDMGISSKAMYFLLGMEADDEGFVSYRKVMRIHGGNEDDIKVLEAKRFIIRFPTGVVVITDWNKNNWLDTRRMKSTEYQLEKAQLALNKDKTYTLSAGLASIEERSRVESNTPQGGGVGKKKKENPDFEVFWETWPKKVAKEDARKAWNKIDMVAGLQEKIIAAIMRNKQSEQWKKSHGAFIPYPASWLNGRRWEDEVEIAEIKSIPSSTVIA